MEVCEFFVFWFLSLSDLQQVSVDKLLVERLAKTSRGRLDNHTSGLQSSNLGASTTLTTGNNGTGVAHTTARRSRDTSNERGDGLGNSAGQVVLLEEISSILLGGTTNLTNHNDSVGLLIFQKDLEGINKVGAREGVTANTDNQRLAQANVGGLVDGLVGQGTGSRHNTNAATLVDGRGHDTDLALLGSNDTGTVGTNKSGLALGLQSVHNANHVVLGNTLSDADNQRDLGLNALHDGSSSNGGRNKDCRGRGTSFLDTVSKTAKDGEAKVGLAGLLGVGTTDNLGAILEGLLGVESALLTSETLVEDLGIRVNLEVLCGVSIAETGSRGRE